MLGVFAVVTGLFAGSLQAASLEIGKIAPDFSLTDIDGKVHRLSDYRDKVVVLEWVNPLCPFVQKHYEGGNIPNQQKAAVNDGIVWLVFNSGHPGAQGDYSPEEVKAWQASTGSAPTAYFRDQDGAVGQLYGAKTTPHMYVINPEGILVYNGAIDSIRSSNPRDIPNAENYVESALTAIKAGYAVKNAATRPYGCTVKY